MPIDDKHERVSLTKDYDIIAGGEHYKYYKYGKQLFACDQNACDHTFANTLNVSLQVTCLCKCTCLQVICVCAIHL